MLEEIKLDSALYVEVDNPDDPLVAAMLAAIRERATITVTGLTVTFDGLDLTQKFWDFMTEGREVRFVVRAGQAKSTAVVMAAGGEVVDTGAVAKMVSRRQEDGHVLFRRFSDWHALKEFLLALGIAKAAMAASALSRLKADGGVSSYELWTRNGAFDLTAFVLVTESDRAGDFWDSCADARNVGPLRIEQLQDLALRLREYGVVG